MNSVQAGLVLGVSHGRVDLVLEHKRKVTANALALFAGQLALIGEFEITLQPETEISTCHLRAPSLLVRQCVTELSSPASRSSCSMRSVNSPMRLQLRSASRNSK